MRKNVILALAVSACALLSCSGSEQYYIYTADLSGLSIEQKVDVAAHLVPTPQQVEWQKCELTAFVHFTVNTFTGREWGDGKEDPAIFNPEGLDTDQWCSALRDGGFKMVIITAKHHDGFCLWQTATTEHCVRNSPWMDGKGDVVAMLKASCEKYGLKLGVYLSPWDRNSEFYGTGKAYDDFFCAQLTELLTNYGEIAEVWFDGANGSEADGKYQEYDWTRYMALIKELQPDAVTAIQGDEIRWIGNEAGKGRSSEWSPVCLPPATARQKAALERDGEKDIHASDINAMSPDLGSRSVLEKADRIWWRPAEVDVSIRPGWFYHSSQDSQVKSLEHLKKIYFSSVGQNAVLLLNIPPDRQGLFCDVDVERLGEFGQWQRETFGREARSTEGFNIICLQEDITKGQRVEAFHVEVSDDGKTWKTIASGTTIGYKRLLRLDSVVKAESVRYVIDGSRAEPEISSFRLYREY